MNLNSIDIHSKGIVRYPPGGALGPRMSADYEFVWIVSGDCRIEISDHDYPAPPDSIFLIPTKCKHCFHWDPKKTTVHGFVHFGIKKPIPGLGKPANWPIVLYLDQREDILRPLLRYVAGMEHFQSPMVRTLAQAALLQSLIVFVNEWQCFGAVALPGGNEIISQLYRNVHLLIDKNSQEEISLTQLARTVKVSPEYLCRLTRQVLSITPMELVYRVRIEKACTLLARTDFSIKQIAQLLGFSNVYHFSRRFTRQTQVPPAQYRRLAYTGQVIPFSHIIPKK